MQYLVMKNRIIYLPHVSLYDIYKPMAHLQDQHNQVKATDADTKRTYTLFKGTLEECQRFLAAFASTINSATEPAIPIKAVLAKMDDENA